MTIDLSSLPPFLMPMAAFCIGIYFLVLSLRYILEAKFKTLAQSPSWKKILRAMPPLLGGVAAAIMYKYPFLNTLPSCGTRFIYGCFGGGVASFLYMVFKAVVQKWFGVKVDGHSTPPAAAEEEVTEPNAGPKP